MDNHDKLLSGKKIFVFDVDGTISLSGKPFAYTRAVFDTLRQKGKSVYIMTNNSSKTTAQYLEGLSQNNIDTAGIEIISSLDTALGFLKKQNMRRVYFAANPAVSGFIESEGFIKDSENPDCILITFDTALTYEKLETLAKLLTKNIPYYVTHADYVCPTDKGYTMPDVGSFIALLQTATGRLPDKSFGKPEPDGILNALEKLDASVSEAVIFGDRLYTDILIGEKCAITTCLVLSGETSLQMYEKSPIQADLVLRDIGEILGLI